HQVLVVRANVRANRAPALRRSLDHRDVPKAGERHLERARNRRSRERQDVDLELELAEQFLLLHPETLLLVDDEQAEVLAPDVAGEKAMGADQDVDPALA